MKLLLTSDWHLDAITAGIPRVGEFDRYLGQVVQGIKDHRVDVVGVLGDFFDPGKMNGPEMTTRLLSAAAVLSRTKAKRILWIAGNHDVVESSDGWTTLSPLAVALDGGFFGRRGPAHTVWQRPATLDLDGFGCLGLPYQARSAVVPGELEIALTNARSLREKGVPLIVLGHMTVPGALQGSESHEMARGRDADLPMSDLSSLEPVVVANGHYHKAQTVEGPKGLQVVIPGSPHRFTFGERHDADKGFVILDLPGVMA